MRQTQGLTLIEVLIAIVIIAVAFIALASSQLTNLRVTRDSELASLATQTANEELEYLIQAILDDYVSYQACPGAADICSGTRSEGSFTVDYDISHDDATYSLKGLILVEINVSGPSSATLSHYVSCMDVSPPPTVTTPGACA